jgi:HSP20 family protein
MTDTPSAAQSQQTKGQEKPKGPEKTSAPRKTNGSEKQTDGSSRSGLPDFLAPADIFENRNEVLLLLDMPGADPQSLDVTLDKRILSVSAHSTPFRLEGHTLVFAEYREGNYRRSFVLPDTIDGDKIEASFKDGVLRLKVPKTAPPPAKKIAVTAS